jgi:mRNA interferase YafQ
MERRNQDLEKLKMVLRILVTGDVLDAVYRDHNMIGSFKSRRECHIEPDWLLIYKIDGRMIIFERTGSHSDLFQ